MKSNDYIIIYLHSQFEYCEKSFNNSILANLKLKWGLEMKLFKLVNDLVRPDFLILVRFYIFSPKNKALIGPS